MLINNVLCFVALAVQLAGSSPDVAADPDGEALHIDAPSFLKVLDPHSVQHLFGTVLPKMAELALSADKLCTKVGTDRKVGIGG